MRINQDYRDKVHKALSHGYYRNTKEFFVLFPDELDLSKPVQGDNVKLALNQI